MTDDKRVREILQDLRRLGREIFEQPCCDDGNCNCGSVTYTVTVGESDDSEPEQPTPLT